MDSIIPLSFLAAMTSPPAPLAPSTKTPTSKTESRSSSLTVHIPSPTNIKPLNTISLRRYLLELIAFSYKIEFNDLAFALLNTVLDNSPTTEESGLSILTAEERLHLLEISTTVARVYAHLKPLRAPSTSVISNSEKMVMRNIVETAQSIGISASHALRHLALYEKHRCRPSKRRKYTVPYSSCSKGVRGLWLGTCWKAKKLAEDLISDVVFVSQMAPNEHTRMVVTEGIEKVRKFYEEIEVERKVHTNEKWLRVLDFCKKNQEDKKKTSHEDAKKERGGKCEKKNLEGKYKENKKKRQKKKHEDSKGKNKVKSGIEVECDADVDSESAVDEFETEFLLENHNRLSSDQPECANPFENPRYEYKGSVQEDANEDSDKDKSEDSTNPTSSAAITANNGPMTTIHSFVNAKPPGNHTNNMDRVPSDSEDGSEADFDASTESSSGWEDYLERTRAISYMDD